MIEEKNIPEIWEFDFENDQILLRLSGQIQIGSDCIVDSRLRGTSKMMMINQFIFLQFEKFQEIFIYSLNGEHVKTIEAGFGLDAKKINGTIYLPNRETKSFWILDEELSITDTKKYFYFNEIVRDYPVNNGSTSISLFNGIEGKTTWEVNISQYGRNIAHHPKTNEVLFDKPNEIDGKLLGDQERIYVPLAGGQLVALSIETGECMWLWESNRKGAYKEFGDHVYKQDGLSVFVINKTDGTLSRKVNFKIDLGLSDFHASGPLWVYEDVIVVCDVLYGKICILNRLNFQLVEFFSLEKKLVNSESAIAWNDGKLYVLDIERTLHVYSEEKA